MDWNGELLDQVETHWHQRLRPRLEGLSDEEYYWAPAPGSWTIHRRGESPAPVSYGAGDYTWDYGPASDGPAPMTTIAWRLGHLIETLASMNGVYFGGPRVTAETFDYPGSAETALRRLDDTYAAWVAGVRELGDEGLAARQGSKSPPEFADAPVARVVLYTSVEIFHHGAEISLLRDLYLREPQAR
ncbi:DinB family protein [Nocardioides iriomotensis]|uniref:DinB family protein n=1 Tax=Nocardioides iriomotensis TaxID=715784 RepID=A0A4Q5IUV1_9ACTN|nr:DinB family protein [Nocardioides iriomotensis]